MSTRTDLLATAEGLAAAARLAAGDGTSMTGADVAAGLATATKATLEAAALAEDIPASDITQALDSIQDLLAEGGVLDKALDLPPAEFLKQTFEALLAWREEVRRAAGYEEAYDGLRGVCERLEQDFLAGDSETSRRLAARLRMALDDGTQIVNQASTGGENGRHTEAR